MKKPTAVISRRVVDPVNSVAWFAMDGLWLAQWSGPAHFAAGATLVTGAMLVALDRRSGQRLNDDLALNGWMWMNACWLVSDLGDEPRLRYVALAIGGVAALLLGNALRPSRRHRKTLRGFRKLRGVVRHRDRPPIRSGIVDGPPPGHDGTANPVAAERT